MNTGKARASIIKHGMQMETTMSGGNPYHGQHIREFCAYADGTAQGAAEEVKKEIPAAVEQEVSKQLSKQLSKQKVQVEVDKQSVKAAQKAINDLFAPLVKWFK